VSVEHTKLVITGAAHDCYVCRQVISKGTTAMQKTKRAETYRERCHADGRGNVSWYAHPECDARRAALGVKS
jgi:hypothetical protein